MLCEEFDRHTFEWEEFQLELKGSASRRIVRVGTKKMINMDFHEILPLHQFKSESKEFSGYFYVEFLVLTRQLI